MGVVKTLGGSLGHDLPCTEAIVASSGQCFLHTPIFLVTFAGSTTFGSALIHRIRSSSSVGKRYNDFFVPGCHKWFYTLQHCICGPFPQAVYSKTQFIEFLAPDRRLEPQKMKENTKITACFERHLQFSTAGYQANSMQIENRAKSQPPVAAPLEASGSSRGK